ncbi:MAG: efflux RND transporter periplasmic adaptor subunit [Desulfobacterales bacterium]
MKLRFAMIALILAALAGAGFFGIRLMGPDAEKGADPSKPKKPPVVSVVAAEQTTLTEKLTLTGSVEAFQTARLASPAEGPVELVTVREGDQVRAGDTLISIGRKKGAQAAIQSLEEELAKETDNLRRTRQLVESQAFPQEALDQARAAVENVRARLVQAKESAGDYVVFAPWDGVVSRLAVRTGEFVAPRTTLVEIYDPASLVIRAAVPERYAAGIQPGMRVDIRLDAYPEKSVKGRIARAYPYLESRLRTRTVEILPEPPMDLLPGMFARLKIWLKTVDDAVVVPGEAVVATPEGKAVFVLENGKALRRPVTTGIEEKNRIQIASGIKAGEKVIVAGNEKLKSGAAVRVAENKEPGRQPSLNRAEGGRK